MLISGDCPFLFILCFETRYKSVINSLQILNYIKLSDSSGNDRAKNYVYQVLMSSDEGKFLMRAYDKEIEFDAKQEEYEPVFKLSSFSRCIIYHEWQRTRAYE